MPRKPKRERQPGSVSCVCCGQAFPLSFVAALIPDLREREPATVQIGSGRAVGSVVAVQTRYGGDGSPVDAQIRPPETLSIPPQAVAATVMAKSAWGWHFDGETWRPTAETRAQWAWACAVMRLPHRYSDQDVRRAREGMARGAFPYRDAERVGGAFMPMIQPELAAEILERFRLPTTIECLRCRAITLVLPNLTTRRIAE